MSISRWRASISWRRDCRRSRIARSEAEICGWASSLTAAPSDLVSGAAGFGASFGAPWVEPVISGSSRLAGKFRFSCAHDFLVWLGL
ncbi:hypothetical protein ACVWXM_007166 [Bradyrhizobium sp. GM7.3]